MEMNASFSERRQKKSAAGCFYLLIRRRLKRPTFANSVWNVAPTHPWGPAAHSPPPLDPASGAQGSVQSLTHTHTEGQTALFFCLFCLEGEVCVCVRVCCVLLLSGLWVM